jgi:putative sterol carrier protein
MAYRFPSDEWIKKMAEELNASEAYQKSAAKWEGDFCFVVEPGPGLPEQAYLYLDLWHGEARDARAVEDESAVNPEFVVRAPVTTWRKVIVGQLDPIRGMMTGQLKLKGTMSKIMRFPKAAADLINCATRVPTEPPE